MKRRFICPLLCLFLAGCTPSDAAPSAPPASSAWLPPASFQESLPEQALSMKNALETCVAFAETLNADFPELEIHLSEDDLSYYERRLSEPDDDLRAELLASISSLRQQVYREMETIRKTGNPLPDGLETLLDDFNASLEEIGW